MRGSDNSNVSSSRSGAGSPGWRCPRVWFLLLAVQENCSRRLSWLLVAQALLGLEMAISLCLHLVFPLCCLSLCPNFPFHRDTNHIRLGPNLMTSSFFFTDKCAYCLRAFMWKGEPFHLEQFRRQKSNHAALFSL